MSHVPIQNESYFKLFNTAQHRVSNNTFIPAHISLLSQCVSNKQICFTTFMSWAEAHQHCRSKGLHLPSIHSRSDMKIISDQVNEIQWTLSQYDVPLSTGDEAHVHVLYQNNSNLHWFKYVSKRTKVEETFSPKTKWILKIYCISNKVSLHSCVSVVEVFATLIAHSTNKHNFVCFRELDYWTNQ